MADKFNFGGRVEIIQGGLFDGQNHHENRYEATFRNEYRNGQRVATYTVTMWADIRNYKENNDGSIELDYYGMAQFNVATSFAENKTYENLTYTFQADKKNNGQLETVWTQTLDLSAPFNTGIIKVDSSAPPQHYRVEAGQTLKIPEKKVAHWYADARISDDEFNFYMGGDITNTNPPNYVPYAQYNGAWKDFNSNNGKILIYSNNIWVDKSQENAATIKQPDKGHNRIYINGQWLQVPPMKGGDV
jgi:hypothetical protein